MQAIKSWIMYLNEAILPFISAKMPMVYNALLIFHKILKILWKKEI